MHGGTGNDDLDGGDGDDVLYGARGNDVLKGGAGVDSFEGGPGDDTIKVDFADFTDGKAAPDNGDRTGMNLFDGGPGSDTLSFADFTNDDGDGNGVTVLATGSVTYDSDAVLTGLFRSIENFIGSPIADNITGEDNRPNIIEGGPGSDTLRGGSGGGDTVSYRNSNSSVTIDLSAANTLDRGRKGHAQGDDLDGFENIIGSAYDDILTGNDQANVIEGLAGADKLDGGTGADTLSYAGSNAGVTIDLNLGTGDFDDDFNTINAASGGHAAGDKVKYESFTHVLGSSHVDRITGDSQDNTLTGGAGNDTLKGGSGDDTLDGGPGRDTLDGGLDDDTVIYSNATEGVTVDLSSVSVNQNTNVVTIRNSSGRGEASGDTFVDIEYFTGSPHDDIFIAGPRADDIDAGDGIDTISYERSRKPVELTLPAPGGNATALPGGLHANQGDETDNYAQGDILDNFENIIGSNRAGSNERADDDGDMIHDKLIGNDEDNVIDGRNGDDKIEGRGGDDTLIGGSGDDIMTGNVGADTFVISGRDTVTDFAPTAEDKLDFGGSSSVLSLDYKVEGGDLVINSGSRQVTLDNISDVTGLNAANFVFNPDGYVRLRDNGTVDATKGSYRILGGAGDNDLRGDSKADTIIGGSGDETIEGRAGADQLEGGAGTDTLSYAGSPARGGDTTVSGYISGVTVALNTSAEGEGTYAEGDTFPTGGNFENLIGSSRDDNLIGDNGANVIDGGSGNDTIAGGNGGADTLKGGSGYDVITGGGDDEVEGGSQSDRLIGSSGDFLSYESSSGVTVDLRDPTTRDLTQTEADRFNDGTVIPVSGIIDVSRGDASGDIATGFVNVIGSRGRDTLIGDDSGNELRGLGDIDTLTGNGGADMLKGGAGNDTLNGGDGDDILDGGPGRDMFNGGNEDIADVATYASAEAGVTVDLSGGNRGAGDAAGDRFEGIERYEGSYHADIFIATDDEENITGGPTTGGPGGAGDTSRDTVSYERSDEGVIVNLTLGTTAQTSAGYASGDTLVSIENVIGSNHRDGDTLTATTGGSVITGGRGDDTLVGGDGSDTFVFSTGDGDDQIDSFTITDGADKIDLSAITSIASLDDLKGKISLRDSDTDLRIDLSHLSSGDAITLNNVTGAGLDTTDTDFYGLTADNFIFYTKPLSNNTGDRFNNEINGGRGDDRIYGEQGRDILNGGAGDDEIYGGEDKDTINGGEGDDWLDGGPGDDTFVFEPGNGNDVIMDFTSGADRIQFKGFTDATGGLISTVTGAADGNGNYVFDLTAVGGGMITVLGVADVPASDYDFIA